MLSKKAIINEVLKEWSWLVPSGMPDATNPEHLEILRSVLTEEFNISKYETDQFIFLLMEDALVPNPNPKGRKKMVTKAYAARWNKDQGGAAPEEDPARPGTVS